MSQQDLASLAEFGLTSLQARVYVALLKLGTAKAGRISTNVGVVRPEVYRVLRELEMKGIVQKNLGPPATYSAIAPTRALSALTKRFEDRLAFLNSSRRALARALSSVTETGSVVERFSVTSGGYDAIISRNIQMIREAKDDYSAVLSKWGLSQALGNGLAKAIVSAKRRNVRVLVISEVDSTNEKSAHYLASHVDLRMSRDVLLYMHIIDSNQMLFGPAGTPDKEELANRGSNIWTNDLKFVGGMHALFERLWEKARPYNPSASCPPRRLRE